MTIPWVVGTAVGGAAIQAGLAVSDPDLFLALWKEANTDQRVELLNNYYQSLERSARSAGLSYGDTAYRRLDADLGAFWSWRGRYNEAIFRRAMPFGGSSWEDELDVWRDKWEERRKEIAAAVGRKELEAQMQARGVDPRFVERPEGFLEQIQRGAEGAAQTIKAGTRSALFWPVVGASVFGLSLVWFAASSGARKEKAA